MLSAVMLGVSVSNHYEGIMSLDKDGLPISESESDEGHGIGLISISNTVKRYGGSMNINTEDNTFSVDIILYCNS
jgi:sensor histidine kinase regulating citrate/malate metabolism